MQGALTDLNVQNGIFTSATDYTKDALEYAKGTYRNQRQVPIDLMHVRPSVEEDEKERIKEIVVGVNVRGLNFSPSSIKVNFGERGLDFLRNNGFAGQSLNLCLDTIYGKNGNTMLTIPEYTTELNKLVNAQDHSQKEIVGETKMNDAYIKIENDILCPIAGLSYKIAIYDFNYEFSITQDGKPVLLIKSVDGSVNKLLTDEELKKYMVDEDGTIMKQDNITYGKKRIRI